MEKVSNNKSYFLKSPNSLINKSVLFSALFMLLTTVAFSQRRGGSDKENAIKYNILGMLAGQHQLSYERAMNDNLSLQLGAGYISRKGTLTDAEWKTSGFIVIPEVRYYFSEVLDGLYGAGFARVRSTKYQYTYVSETTGTDYGYQEPRFVIGGGAVLGYQPIIGDGFILDIFAGPQFKSVSSTRTYNDPGADLSNASEGDELKSGFGFRFGLNLGIAF